MKIFRILLTFVLTSFVAFACNAQSAASVLDKAVAKLSKASSVNCSFSVSGDGGSTSGSFRSSGSKFQLKTPAGTTWFDGRNMWTSNSRTKEITLVNPSQQEVNEINPFAYLNSYKSKYITGFSKRKDNNRYLVLINPRDKKDPIKAVEIAINKKTFLPERFIIRDRNNKVSTVYVKSLSITNKNPASDFICPVSSMSDYELIDLR